MPLVPDLGQQPVSPFKQSSMMSWNLSSYPTPLDPSSLSIAMPTSNFMKSFLDASSSTTSTTVEAATKPPHIHLGLLVAHLLHVVGQQLVVQHRYRRRKEVLGREHGV